MKVSFGVLHLALSSVIFGLNLNERNELQRKFKYYFQNVRPTAPENYVSGRNGSFFSISTEITIRSTHIKSAALFLDADIHFSWTDDRLNLRELNDRVELPEEFSPWTPRIQIVPSAHSLSLFLSPTTGEIHWYHRIKNIIACSCDNWKHPFQTYSCELAVENIGNEVIVVSDVRDIRVNSQKKQMEMEQVDYPSANIRFFFSSEWQSAILSVYLPSLIIISLVFFSQWKRRKVQVLVSVVSLVCLLVMLTPGRSHSGATLLDLWLSGCFLHAAFFLAVDLILPARRVRYSLMVERTVTNTHHILAKADQRKKGLRGYLSRFADRTLGLSREQSTSSELVSACPSEQTPVQRHVTKATLGQRKRFCLLIISSSFIAFIFIYFLLIFSID